MDECVEKIEMQNLLVELQTEELPPKALYKLMQAFAERIHHHLKAANFLSETSSVTPLATPRRLSLIHI